MTPNSRQISEMVRSLGFCVPIAKPDTKPRDRWIRCAKSACLSPVDLITAAMRVLMSSSGITPYSHTLRITRPSAFVKKKARDKHKILLTTRVTCVTMYVTCIRRGRRRSRRRKNRRRSHRSCRRHRRSRRSAGRRFAAAASWNGLRCGASYG